MDMNLMEVEYLINARKAEVAENMRLVEIYHQYENEKRQKYCVRVFGFEICI
jgi:hypothetical protein